MPLTVKLFGPIADAANQREMSIAIDRAVTGDALRRAIVERHPDLADAMSQARFAVNHEFIRSDELIRPGDEVALIGPVSGG